MQSVRFLVIVACFLVTTSAVAEDISSQIEKYMRVRVEHDHFNGTILVARDGEPLVRKGYGMANLELDVPNTPKTKFRIGSLTKQFTAMAVMILQEQGKLDVRDKIKKYWDDIPKAWNDITITHLLTHTSGIPNYTAFVDFVTAPPVPVTVDQVIARFKDKPLETKPGAAYKYCNSGYVVLGKLIEKVAGRSYGDFLAETIFNPLGMKDTGFDRAIPILKNRADGYSRPFATFLNSRLLDMSLLHACGALYSTVDDLSLWDRALYTNKLVSKGGLEKIFTPHQGNYGFGWSIVTSCGRPLYTHTGSIGGFICAISRFPNERVCVIVLSNVEGTPVLPVARDLSAIALGEPCALPGPRNEIAIDTKLYDSYVGIYEFNNGAATITITRDQNRLMSQLTQQRAFPIFPQSETCYFYKVVDAQLEFVNDARGRVTHAILHQGPIDMKAQRRAEKK